MFKIFSKKNGFTLIELLTVVAIMGILVAIASLGKDFIYSHRLHAASRELYSDLLAMRFAAMTRSSFPNNSDLPDSALKFSHGFGIRFRSASQYAVFEFVENEDPLVGDAAFTWEDADEELVLGVDLDVDEEAGWKVLPNGVTVTVGAAGTTPVGDANLLLYDKHGMIRNNIWSNVSNLTYVLHHPQVGQARCVVISPVRIREGAWNANTCN